MRAARGGTMRTTLAVHEPSGGVSFIREFDYECAGESIHVTDAVNVDLVEPRARKYEQAGAAHTAEAEDSTRTPETTAG